MFLRAAQLMKPRAAGASYFEAGTLPSYPYESTGWTNVINSGGGSITAVSGGDGLEVVATASIMGYTKDGITGVPESLTCSTSYSPSLVKSRGVGLLQSTTGSRVYLNFYNMDVPGAVVCDLTFYDGTNYNMVNIPISYLQQNGDTDINLDFVNSNYDITVGVNNFVGSFNPAWFNASDGWTNYVVGRYGTETYNHVRIEGDGFPY